VFNGIADFVHNKPVIITGDNYNQVSSLFSETEIRINIFNVSKFAREIKPTKEGGRNLAPRIKRLSEYLGQSYWEYLSNLNDLVILMDEAHRYHADKSKEAINELKPILGIELTATPKDEKGNMFRNVVYEYSLAIALKEGLYIKAPAIATRKDFDPNGIPEKEIEEIKIIDAINVHEETKRLLEEYSKNENKKLVKPLILIAAKNTDHAKELYEQINSFQFMQGAYKDKVLQIDSTTVNDDEVEQLYITLESADNPIEIVIHVFKLKEGWDVNNLYTICPLNAFNSEVFIEQTIGRGLRLPFGGERTGVEAIDKLTIIAHDHFVRILKEADNPNSELNKIKLIEVYVDPNASKQLTVSVPQYFTQKIEDEKKAVEIENAPNKQQKLNQLDARRLIIHHLPSIANDPAVRNFNDAKKEEVREKVIENIKQELFSGQPSIFADSILQEVIADYDKVVTEYELQTIAIPRIVMMIGSSRTVFHDFDLDTADFNYQKLKEQIMVINLSDKKVIIIDVTKQGNPGNPISKLIVELNNHPEIDYETAELQNKLCNQAIAAIESTLDDKSLLPYIIEQWKRPIAEKIYNQMVAPPNFEVLQGDFEKPKYFSFGKIEDWNFSGLVNNGFREFTDETMKPSDVSKYIFTDFKKACHRQYKFANRTEQTFAFILENDQDVLKWMRPSLYQFRIYWSAKGQTYQPDFIAETADFIYMIETKAADDIKTEEVQAKKIAALKYCEYANEFINEQGGKEWKYAIIPHDKVVKNGSFKGVVSNNIYK
jgi:type III restriction enzyme